MDVTELIVHHSVARFAWHVVQADGTALPEGIDIASSPLTARESSASLASSDPLPAQHSAVG